MGRNATALALTAAIVLALFAAPLAVAAVPSGPSLTTAEVRTYQSQSRQIVDQLQDTTSIGVWILDDEHFTDLSRR